MSLAKAISKNAPSLAAAQNTYKENVVAVNTLVNNVMSSKLPPLNQYPPDWQQFEISYVTATGDALDWVNNVLARLLSVPDEVQNYNPLISGLLQDAKRQAEALKNDPSNTAAKAALTNDLSSLSSQLSLVTTFISSTLTAIRGFKDDKLPEMATQLQSIADRSTQDADADQAQIDQLKADVKRLQDDISSLTAEIVGLGIADGAALTMGTIATIAAWPFGALTWLVMGPVVAVSSTFIALDAIKIKEDNAVIDADKKQITGLTADVSTLHLLSQNFAALASASQQVEANLQAVLNEWQTLESDVNAAITDINAATSDEQGSNFSAVVTDIDNAVTEWNAAYAQAGALHLDLKVNNASLAPGMSSDQVRSAMANATTMDAIQYFNSVGNMAQKKAA